MCQRQRVSQFMQQSTGLLRESTDIIVAVNRIRYGRIWLTARLIIRSPQPQSDDGIRTAIEIGVPRCAGGPKIRDSELRFVTERVGSIRDIRGCNRECGAADVIAGGRRQVSDRI